MARSIGAPVAALLLLLLLAGAVSVDAGSMRPQEVLVLQRLGVDQQYLQEKGYFLRRVRDVISSIRDRLRSFRDWMARKFRHILDAVKPHVEILKEMALAFIKEMTKAAIEGVIEAGYEYFREHQMEIGEALWGVVEALYRKYLEGKLEDQPQLYDFSVKTFDNYVLAGYKPEYLLTRGFFIGSIGSVINSISNYFRSFKDWISRQMSHVWDKVQPQVETLREMAKEFVREMTIAAIEAVIEAGYEFFHERQSELGEAVWTLVEKMYRKYLEDKLRYRVRLH